ASADQDRAMDRCPRAGAARLSLSEERAADGAARADAGESGSRASAAHARRVPAARGQRSQPPIAVVCDVEQTARAGAWSQPRSDSQRARGIASPRDVAARAPGTPAGGPRIE